VGLKLIFLIATRAVSLLGLSGRETWWKDAEILMLRHQLAVAQRERPRAHARMTWPDRAWLALLAGTLPIERVAALRLIVTPATILRWHRDLLRRRWARLSRRGRSGRPPTRHGIRSVVVRLARENESWGYRRIHGELAVLGITVAPSTVWQILKDAGSDPAPRRDGPGWAEFLRSQAQAILALDFFAADLLNGTKVYVLAVIEHGSRRVRVLGATEHPVQFWVVQQARNLLMDLDDAAIQVKFVLHDRDASFSAAFDAVFRAADQGHPQRGTGPPDELDHGALDRQLPPRTARPDPDLEPTPPDGHPARVRGLLQRSPAAPRPEPGRAAASLARRRRRPRSFPGPAA
jgi:transposase